MKIKDFGYLFIILIFVIAGALSWNLYFKVYRQQDTVDIHQFPKTIGGWTSEELPISDDSKAILETDNVFVRRYTEKASGKEAYLFIVYSQSNRKVSHPPEVCYTGAGAVILSSAHDSFSSLQTGETIDANRLTVEKGNSKQVFFYWFKVGDSFTPSYWKQQGLIALKSFLGEPASSALIRISVTVTDGDEDKAAGQIKEFGRLVLPYLPKYLP